MTGPLRLLTIIGARPQIIKAAAISRAVSGPFAGRVQETILHTGQHYDHAMSGIFFEELGIPPADIQLNIGAGKHGARTGRMMEAIEQVLEKERPDVVVVYGDTDSTLAGALAAAKLHVRVAHIEAGLRSYNKRMPEEINRITADHCSTWLFCPTHSAMDALRKEGIGLLHGPGSPTMDEPRVVFSGDVMFDNTLHFSALALERSKIFKEHGIEAGRYMLATIHRAANTDDPSRLTAILDALVHVHKEHDLPVVLPLHPRTRESMGSLGSDLLNGSGKSNGIRIIPPVGYLDMLALEHGATLVFTDSGGVQKEAYFHGRPSVVLREETEWVEIVDAGMAILADADPLRIRDAAARLMGTSSMPEQGLFGDGHAAEHICEVLLEQ